MFRFICITALIFLTNCERSNYTRDEITTSIEWKYDEFIMQTVSSIPELLNIEPKMMSNFCPKWSSLKTENKIKFWSDLLYSMAGPESNWEPTAMFWEKSMGIDMLTKSPIVSEGLLQLSYQDKLWYKDCRFIWHGDKEKFMYDWNNRNNRQSWKSKYPDRSTLIPENNLHCGIMIYKHLIVKNKNKKFEDIGGMYWAVMRTRNKAYKQVIANMQKRKSECF